MKKQTKFYLFVFIATILFAIIVFTVFDKKNINPIQSVKNKFERKHYITYRAYEVDSTGRTIISLTLQGTDTLSKSIYRTGENDDPNSAFQVMSMGHVYGALNEEAKKEFNDKDRKLTGEFKE